MAKKEEQLKTITELALLIPEIQPSLLKFEVTRKQLAHEALLCMKIKVTDTTSLSVCENSLTKINDLVKSVEEVRISEKEPYLKRGKAIDDAAKYVSSLPKEAIEHLKDQKKAYVLEQERKKALKDLAEKIGDTLKAKLESFIDIESLDKYVEAIKNFDYKAKYEDYASNAIVIKNSYMTLFELKRKELEAIESGIPEEIEAIQVAQEEAKETIEEEKVERVIQSSFAFSDPKKVRRPWAFELIDLNKVPKDWLMLDESKVKEFLKNNKDELVENKVINGIKFFKDLTITA